jgi:hypothetical protein
MDYKLLTNNAVLRIDDNTDINIIIPFDPDNRDYQEYLNWLSKGNTPQPPDIEPSDPDWKTFLNAVRTTSAFNKLRNASKTNLEANTLATELRVELTDAAFGNPNIIILQLLVNQLLLYLTLEEKQELLNVINLYNIPLIISLE